MSNIKHSDADLMVLDMIGHFQTEYLTKTAWLIRWLNNNNNNNNNNYYYYYYFSSVMPKKKKKPQFNQQLWNRHCSRTESQCCMMSTWKTYYPLNWSRLLCSSQHNASNKQPQINCTGNWGELAYQRNLVQCPQKVKVLKYVRTNLWPLISTTFPCLTAFLRFT